MSCLASNTVFYTYVMIRVLSMIEIFSIHFLSQVDEHSTSQGSTKFKIQKTIIFNKHINNNK